MSKIQTVRVRDIESNPFRSVEKYPYVERKLEVLMKSIEEVGLWEGVIARERKEKYQLAFGHHRIEAARRSGLKEVLLVVRALTDEQMLQFMGRENMEDYNADFLCMLETWEAAVKFLALTNAQMSQALAIARLLGWTAIRSEDRRKGDDAMNATARACNAAHALIAGGYLKRDDLRDMTVSAAQQIVERAQARMEQLERMAKQTQRPRQEIEQAKKQVAKGARETAREVRSGNVAQRDIRAQVDVNAFKFSQETKKPTPPFAAFGKILVKNIEDAFGRDHFAEKLEQVAKAVNQITLEEDHAVLRQLDFALSVVPRRTEVWRKRLRLGSLGRSEARSAHYEAETLRGE